MQALTLTLTSMKYRRTKKSSVIANTYFTLLLLVLHKSQFMSNSRERMDQCSSLCKRAPLKQKTIYNHVDTLTYTRLMSFSPSVCSFTFFPFCFLNHKNCLVSCLNASSSSSCSTGRVNLQLTFMSKSRHIFRLFLFLYSFSLPSSVSNDAFYVLFLLT